MTQALRQILKEIRSCTVCESELPHAPRPVLVADPRAVILIAGQAPGRKVHETGIPWNDPSGDRLRGWLGLTRTEFYDRSKIAIIPMGFCFPGTGPSGDYPPRPECRRTWHERLLPLLRNIKLRIIVGSYAQNFHLPQQGKPTLTQTVAAWRQFAPDYFPLPHPSPRNQLWLRRNPWFEHDVLPQLRATVQQVLESGNRARHASRTH